uniref:VIT domain-containing protein n=1 Tax=Seriola lalandi dorsalis TaxID=1841481 RepID=A0A3B4YHP3_SERLL
MVGLRNRSTWEPLLLKASCIKSCANGCSLGITAHLTYANADIESVEGVFVYPLGEKEVVVGFEAAIAGRLVGVQIQNRGKLKDCCLDCCPGTENMEALLSPNEIPPLYPGNRLIGYCTLYDMTNFKAKKAEVFITTFFVKSMFLCVYTGKHISSLSVLLYSVKDRAINIGAPRVLFLANQMMSFHLLLPLN